MVHKNQLDRLEQKLEAKLEELERAIKGNKEKPDWLDPQDTLELLKCSSRHLQTLRDTGRIGYSKIGNKKIMYSRASIEKLLQDNYKFPFNQ